MTKERKFYDALKDVFVGAKVEGESGYINLMRIKSRYYEEGVFPKLKKDIEEVLKPFPDFREELFDKLYTFFSRYFSESGSIYFRYTPLHQNIYEKVYTDDKDVMLFWKTHMLYYVKTDHLFRSLEVEMDGVKFFFDVSTLEHKKANEKREIIYEFKEKRGDGTLVFRVAYSERGRKTKLSEIQKALKREDAEIDEETLERAFRVFERQSEVDYFINKNAKAFLQEQFNLWLYQYVFSGESDWTEKRIKQLQALKSIAYKIIDFISQFEDELVKIWNKPKFVLNSNYVITLDRIAERDMGLVEQLLDHENFQRQVEEWQTLGIVNEDFNKEAVIKQDLLGKRLNDAYRHLPIDTKYFKDLELDILGLFDNLDEALDGWLIKSENYQALNALLPKFRERVKCIYIDPPYNSKFSEIDYQNRFKHSSWLALMENRINLGKNCLREDGVLIVAIDENEQERLGLLIDDVLPNYFKTCISIVHNPRGIQGDAFSYCHDYAYFVYPKPEVIHPRIIPKEEWEFQNLRNWGGESRREDGKNCFYPIYVKDGRIVRLGEVPPDDFHPDSKMRVLPSGEIEVWPIDRSGIERKWRYQRESLKKVLFATRVVQRKGGDIEIELARIHAPFKTVWADTKYDANTYGSRLLTDMGLSDFSFPKSLYTVRDCLHAIVQDGSNAFIMDFFAGSGTTAHAVINLNREDGGRRKYIMVEMADYFDTVLLPRIKKVVFSDKWKDGKAQNCQGISHFVKYYTLEQYEDTLRKAKYEDSDLFDNPYQDPYSQYVFLRDLKMLEALEVDMNENKVKVDLSKLYPDDSLPLRTSIDIAETLSNLTGKWIKKITVDLVEFEDGGTVDIKNLDWKLIKPLIWW